MYIDLKSKDIEFKIEYLLSGLSKITVSYKKKADLEKAIWDQWQVLNKYVTFAIDNEPVDELFCTKYSVVDNSLEFVGVQE